jgi:pimeloyl-ACP methyl ester carboxylesterase
LRRPALGQVILKSWHDSLKHNEMRSCAWSFIINGYSDKFLNKFATKLSLFVDIIIKSNDPKKLFHLLEHSHVVDDSHPYSIPSCCPDITCKTQVIASRSDRIAGHAQVRDLAAALTNSIFADMDGGHLAPFEEPAEWRRLVLEFLNSE